MPLSDKQRQGFQNKVIELLAQSSSAHEVSYFWRPYLERGLTRETFANNECDVLLDMPADSRSVLTTIPIYRSTYVLAYLADKHYDFKSFADPRPQAAENRHLPALGHPHGAGALRHQEPRIRSRSITSDADLRAREPALAAGARSCSTASSMWSGSGGRSPAGS